MYGDKIYVHGAEISRAPQEKPRSPVRKAELRGYNACRTSIEQVFGNVSKLWKMLDAKLNKKLFASSRRGGLGALYRVAALLTNCHACLNGPGPVGSFFANCDTPDLEDYLSM